jgi:hypothetical protein
MEQRPTANHAMVLTSFRSSRRTSTTCNRQSEQTGGQRKILVVVTFAWHAAFARAFFIGLRLAMARNIIANVHANTRLSLARPVFFHRTRAGTTISVRRIAVVACFNRRKNAITTLARHAYRRRPAARPAFFHDTRRIAAIAIDLIAIVASFIACDIPVSAYRHARDAITDITAVAGTRE